MNKIFEKMESIQNEMKRNRLIHLKYLITISSYYLLFKVPEFSIKLAL